MITDTMIMLIEDLCKTVLTGLVYRYKLTLVYRYKPTEEVMGDIELAAVQERFADIVWANEPISSGDLVRVCERELNWKKPTTYTVLRKLCEKGILKNENGTVSSVISKGEFYQQKGAKVINDYYKGSLPAFIASFTDRNALSAQDINEIQELINRYKKDNGI